MKREDINELAAKLYAAMPSTYEGDLALAAWRRCVNATADVIHRKSKRNAALFVSACERGRW